LPVLRVIKRQLPYAQVFWWIEASLAPLLRGDPDLAGIFIFDRKGWRTLAWWRDVWRTVRNVRNQGFDYVIDLQGLSRSAFFAWLANGNTIIGLDNAREGNREGAQIFYDLLAPRSPPGTPASERYLSVLTNLNLPVTWNFDWLPPGPRNESAATSVAPTTLPYRPSVVLLPGARWQNKRWPAEFFAKTVARLTASHPDCKFAIMGVAGDRPLAEIISRAAPERCLDLTGRTSLSEMVEWLRSAEVVISNDTGPLHVAAALGRPIVAIYGPSDPRYTGPHNQAAGVLQATNLPCVPCMKQACQYHEPLACLWTITPEQVVARASAILSTRKNADLQVNV